MAVYLCYILYFCIIELSILYLYIKLTAYYDMKFGKWCVNVDIVWQLLIIFDLISVNVYDANSLEYVM